MLDDDDERARVPGVPLILEEVDLAWPQNKLHARAYSTEHVSSAKLQPLHEQTFTRCKETVHNNVFEALTLTLTLA